MTSAATEAGSRARGIPGRLARSAALKALLGASIVAAVIILGRGWGLLQPFELWIYDALRVAWAGHSPSKRILLVGATEADVERWDWPLKDGDLATLLERLAGWQPRVIAVDLYRDHPEPPGTERLAAVLREHKNIVWAFKLKDAAQPGIAPPAALRGTGRTALADVVADPGGVVRRGLLFADDGVENYPTIGMAVASGYLARDHIGLAPGPDGALRLGKALIAPLDDRSGPYLSLDSRGYQTLLDYSGGPDPFPRESVGDVMHGDAAAPLVRGRAVIIGVTSESVKDFFATPFDTGFADAGPASGIALHGDVADQMIREALGGGPSLRFLSRGLEDLWIWGWAIAGALLGMVVGATLPAVLGMVAGLALLAGIVYAAFGAALLLPALPAALAWAGSAGLANQLLHAQVNRARAHLRKTFEHYLPPAVIAQMLESGRLPQLGGERREISVLFSDVAGFTTLSERLDPIFLTDLTNQYFEGVCAAIFKERGLVNEFAGDGVLAFFGAPQEQPDHADRAVAAALEIDSFAQRFSAEQKARGIDFGHTRIGVHTGVAMVGNVGSRARLKYSAQGDTLNTGSRLEGLNKAIGTRICVSGATVKKARRHRFRPIGAFVVKGRRGATDIFEPLAPERYDPAAIARYEAAFSALAQGEPDAGALFAALRRDCPDDPCVAFHAARLEAGETGSLIVMTEK
jgi:adenylate cyclase